MEILQCLQLGLIDRILSPNGKQLTRPLKKTRELQNRRHFWGDFFETVAAQRIRQL